MKRIGVINKKKIQNITLIADFFYDKIINNENNAKRKKRSGK